MIYRVVMLKVLSCFANISTIQMGGQKMQVRSGLSPIYGRWRGNMMMNRWIEVLTHRDPAVSAPGAPQPEMRYSKLRNLRGTGIGAIRSLGSMGSIGKLGEAAFADVPSIEN